MGYKTEPNFHTKHKQTHTEQQSTTTVCICYFIKLFFITIVKVNFQRAWNETDSSYYKMKIVYKHVFQFGVKGFVGCWFGQIKYSFEKPC